MRFVIACSFFFALSACVNTLGKPSADTHAAAAASRVVTLPPLPALAGSPVTPAAIADNITVYQASQPLMSAPPGATVNLEFNFSASSASSTDDKLLIDLVDANGAVALSTLSVPSPSTAHWLGPVTNVVTVTLPVNLSGPFYILVSLNNGAGPVQLLPGPGVTQDNQTRFYIGTVNVSAGAPFPSPLGPVLLDLSNYTLSFDEEFNTLSVSDAAANDGSRWYALNSACCMVSSNGFPGAMAGVRSARNPFSLTSGGGLDIRLQNIASSWSSGALTSVDASGAGFAQQYGYFEMKAKFPTGAGTWPAFALLDVAHLKNGSGLTGEIDVVQHFGQYPFSANMTLHDWSANASPAFSGNSVLDTTADFHTYGLMWTAGTMTFYFDGTVTFQTPTPAVMNQPYYLTLNLGLGGGWPTESTPATNDLLVKYVRAYSPK